MNRIVKLTRMAMKARKPAQIQPAHKQNGGLTASWSGVLGLSVLLVGGFVAFLVSGPAPHHAIATAPDAGAAIAPFDNAAPAQSVSTTQPAKTAAAPNADDAKTPAVRQLAGKDAPEAGPRTTAAPPAPASASAGWVAANGETPAFGLDPLPQLAGTAALRGLMAQPVVVEGVLHASGGGRDDALMIGDPHAAGPLFRLSLYRPGSEPQPGGSFFVDVARRTGEAGMWVERFVALPSLESRLGAVEIALAKFGGHAGGRNCVAFRHSRAQPDLRVSGWICLDGEMIPAPEAVACVIDAVRWQRTQEEPQLDLLFSKTARAPGATCGPPSAGDLTSSIRVAPGSIKAGAR